MGRFFQHNIVAAWNLSSGLEKFIKKICSSKLILKMPTQIRMVFYFKYEDMDWYPKLKKAVLYNVGQLTNHVILQWSIRKGFLLVQYIISLQLML